MNEQKVGLAYGGILLIVYLASKIFKQYESLFMGVFIHLFLILLLGYGIYFTIGVIRNSDHFRKAYKPIDLTELLGDFGRVLYVLIGMMCVGLSIFLFCIYHGIIK